MALLFPSSAQTRSNYGSINTGSLSEEETEKSNFFRIMSLTLELGREQIMHYVLRRIAPTSNLENELRRRGKFFHQLKLKKKLSQEKYDILYPPSGGIIAKDRVDLGLWYTLARNLKKQKFDWGYYEHNPPAAHETDATHDVVRIRNARNFLAHSNTSCLSSREFRRMWDEIAAAILRLDPTQETQNAINTYRDCNLDPGATQRMHLSLKTDALQETETLYRQEIGKRRYTIIGFVVTILILTAAMGSLGYVLYSYGRTWQNCAENLVPIQLNDGANLNYMPRKGWGALPRSSSRGPFPQPIRPRTIVIIASSEQIGRCSSTSDCCYMVRNIQKFNINDGYADICYSFLIGNDGVIYEGRGFNEVPATAQGWNLESISIAFIGEYTTSLPSDDALSAGKQFLQYMADQNIVNSNFTLYGLCQVRPYPDVPGLAFYKEIQNWKSAKPGYTWQWRPREGWCRKSSSAEQPLI